VKDTREGGALWQVDGREPLEHATPVCHLHSPGNDTIRIQVDFGFSRRETIQLESDQTSTAYPNAGLALASMRGTAGKRKATSTSTENTSLGKKSK
jgi:hypothetical protein